MIELEKVYYFFKDTILSSPSGIILIKPTNFVKQEVMENTLVSSRASLLVHPT